MAAAAKTKRFQAHEGATVRIPFQHLDRDVVLHDGKVYETSDQTVIDALEAHPYVKAAGTTKTKTKPPAKPTTIAKPASPPSTAARTSSSSSSTAATPPGDTAPDHGNQGGQA